MSRPSNNFKPVFLSQFFPNFWNFVRPFNPYLANSVSLENLVLDLPWLLANYVTQKHAVFSYSGPNSLLTQFFSRKTFLPLHRSWDLNTLTAISTWAKNSGFELKLRLTLLLEREWKMVHKVSIHFKSSNICCNPQSFRMPWRKISSAGQEFSQQLCPDLPYWY